MCSYYDNSADDTQTIVPATLLRQTHDGRAAIEGFMLSIIMLPRLLTAADSAKMEELTGLLKQYDRVLQPYVAMLSKLPNEMPIPPASATDGDIA